MDIATVKSGAAEVSKYFFESKKGHLDKDTARISSDEVSYCLNFGSTNLSANAKVFMEGLLFRKVFLSVSGLDGDTTTGVSLEDINILASKQDAAQIEKIFQTIPQINVLENSTEYGINTKESIHSFQVFPIGGEKKLIYVARGDLGLSPTGFWVGNIQDDFGQEYISLEGKQINNADFGGLDVKNENGEVVINILNRPTSKIEIKRVTNNIYEFNLGGKGQNEINHIIVYDREDEKQYYADLQRKFFIHKSEKEKFFNKDGRLVSIRMNANKSPNTVTLPFSLERLTVREQDLKGLFLEEKIKHSALTDDGVMMGVGSIPGANAEQLAVYKMLATSDTRGIVSSDKGVYVFGEVNNDQKVFFIDKDSRITLIDKGLFFSNNFGVQNAKVIAASYSSNSFVLLVQNSERKDGDSIRTYYLASITEEELHSSKEWNLSPFKVITDSLSPEATIRSMSVSNNRIYLLSDDPSREDHGKKEHIIHELSSEVSSKILGAK